MSHGEEGFPAGGPRQEGATGRRGGGMGPGAGDLPCAGAHVGDADVGVRQRKGNGRVDEVVYLRPPEVVLEVEPGGVVRCRYFWGGREERRGKISALFFTSLRLCSYARRHRSLGCPCCPSFGTGGNFG